MDDNNRPQNIGMMLIGIMTMVICLPALIHHQYVYFIPGEHWSEGWYWESTIGLLLAGAWLFVFGLVGFVREKGRKGPE